MTKTNKTDSKPTLGRKRDHSRDADILNATLNVLAESGYERMTMDMVANEAKAGKGTMYRRWASKAELVLESIEHMKLSQFNNSQLPDTGTLRGDILALLQPQSVEDAQRKLKIMAGVATLISQHQSLADAAHAAFVEPWIEVNKILIERSIKRGEASKTSNSNIKIVSQILPSMAAYRMLIARKDFDRPFAISLVDNVLLPTLGIQKTKPSQRKSK